MKISPQDLPPRIILSRKGSDSAWGGRSSLQMGRKIISLPVPEYQKKTPRENHLPGHLSYSDLPLHPELGNFADYLDLPSRIWPVHLDPDIRLDLRPKAAGNAHLFGQEGAAQGHLTNQEIGKDSLFLFFGWFREAVRSNGQWKRRGTDQHMIWGWFQVENSFPVTNAQEASKVDWARHHPHVSHWPKYGAQNRLYVARKHLSFAKHLAGAGVFHWTSDLVLTQICSSATRRHWCMPAIFSKTQLSYNTIGTRKCPSDNTRVHFPAACIGQEFVCPDGRNFELNERKDIAYWLERVFEGGTA